LAWFDLYNTSALFLFPSLFYACIKLKKKLLSYLKCTLKDRTKPISQFLCILIDINYHSNIAVDPVVVAVVAVVADSQ
jgi:hypothetical protein